MKRVLTIKVSVSVENLTDYDIVSLTSDDTTLVTQINAHANAMAKCIGEFVKLLFNIRGYTDFEVCTELGQKLPTAGNYDVTVFIIVAA